MHTILYAAITTNGFIAHTDDTTEWSDAEWEAYLNVVNKVGVLIIGRRTYDIMSKEDSLNKVKAKVIVLTKSIPMEDTNNDNVIFFNDSPEQVLDYIETEGFSSAVIGGGSQVYGIFLKENLVNEVILDIEPFIYGTGVPLAFPYAFSQKLSLRHYSKISDNTIQLQYLVTI